MSQPAEGLRLVTLDRLGDGRAFHGRVILDRSVEPPQEFAAGRRKVLPGILPVQDDGHDRITAGVDHSLGRCLDLAQKVLRRAVRIHPGIDEADEVGKRVVPEDQVHAGVVLLEAVDVVKALGRVRGQHALPRPREVVIDAAAEYALVGGHPLHAQAMPNGHDLVRDAALRRPHALGPHPEHAFVHLHAAAQLLARIFRMLKAVLGQWQTRRRHAPHVRIAQQRQDGVVVRRAGDFNAPALRGCRIRGQHRPQDLTLLLDHELLVLGGEVAAFARQRLHVLLFEEELVKPCQLRKYL